jgi:uncharacterized protein
LLPQTLLRASVHLEGERIVPHYFTFRDEPWLRALIHEYARFAGCKRSELQERLNEPLPTRAPKAKLRIAMVVLDALSGERVTAAVPAKEARAAVFRKAAVSSEPRAAVLQSVALSLGVSANELERSLLADLRSERCVADLPASLSAARVAREANLALVTSLIRRATQVRIVVSGHARALVRHARLVGLICRESAVERDADGVQLDVSGPLALFHHSDVYGRALASLVPRVVSSGEFELAATCALGRDGQLCSFVVRSGDPVGAGDESMPRANRVEKKFERDFRRVAPDWQLNREPCPIVSGKTLIFPDFEIVHRHDPSRRWFLDIVGFWTDEYLCEKLRRLSAAGIDNVLLCIDRNRNCTEPNFPPDTRVVRYETRIDAHAILAILAGDLRRQ